MSVLKKRPKKFFDIKRGTTRLVLLAGKYAFKLPRIGFHRYCWKNLLLGLLGNMNERVFGYCGFVQLCPVLFHIPGGFLVVMPRTFPLTDAEWERFDFDDFFGEELSSDLVENKKDSFGKLNNNIVAVDYG